MEKKPDGELGPPPWMIADLDDQGRVAVHAKQADGQVTNIAVSPRDARLFAIALLTLADKAEQPTG